MKEVKIEALQKALSPELEKIEMQYGYKRILAKIYFYLLGWIGLVFFFLLMLLYYILSYIKIFIVFFIVFFLIEEGLEGLVPIGTVIMGVIAAILVTLILYGPIMYSESYFATVYKKSLYPFVFDVFFKNVDYIIGEKKDIDLAKYEALPLYQYQKPIAIAQLDIDDAVQIMYKGAIIYFHEVPNKNLLHLNILFKENNFEQMTLGQSSREEAKYSCFNKKNTTWFTFETNEAFSLHLPSAAPDKKEIKKDPYIKKLLEISSEYEYPIHFAVNSNKNIQIAIEYKAEGFLELSADRSLFQSPQKAKKNITNIIDASNKKTVNEEVIAYLFEEMTFLQKVIKAVVE